MIRAALARFGKVVNMKNKTVNAFIRCLPPWDGVERLGLVPSGILGGSESDLLARECFKRWAVGAIRCVLRPGVRPDAALVLGGGQGQGKSTFWAALGGEWFGHAPAALEPSGPVSGWIVELPLDGLECTEKAVSLKAFMTARVDAPFVCVGSTNRPDFLEAWGSSRRFWCLSVPKGWQIRVDQLREIRLQLWAEALRLERQGFPHWLTPELEALRVIRCEGRSVEDPWDSMIAEAVGRIRDEAAKDGECCLELEPAAIFRGMGFQTVDQTPEAMQRLSACMARLGFVRVQKCVDRAAAAMGKGRAIRPCVWMIGAGLV